MTTPLVPELPELPEPHGTARRAADRTIERAAVIALLLGPALAVAGSTSAAPSLVAVTVLLAVAALGRDTASWRSASAASPAEEATTCGLEDATDTLRCHRPAGHSGAHCDARADRAFEDTLADHIGEAGAYYRDRRGRPVPIDDAF